MRAWSAKCPADPSHGRVLDWPSANYGWYCPHQGHFGRPRSHPAGPAPQTRAMFTTAEVEQQKVEPGREGRAPRKGEPR